MLIHLIRQVTDKAKALWNKQIQSPLVADTIKKAVGRKLKTPIATRWNSLYDSMEVLHGVLNSYMTQINNICIAESQATFNNMDKDIMAEYLTAMKPVVTSLDKLHGEKDAYMGLLLPTLYMLKAKLQSTLKTNPQYAQNLVTYLLNNPCSTVSRPKGFQSRFSELFNRIDLLKATAVHPYFKLGAVRRINASMCDRVRAELLVELTDLVNSETPCNSGSADNDEQGDDFFQVTKNL